MANLKAEKNDCKFLGTHQVQTTPQKGAERKSSDVFWIAVPDDARSCIY